MPEHSNKPKQTSMASKTNFEDLDLSQEEIKRISEALKDEKFRKMFVEYAEEISNPENRKKYEEEIAMMEQERGMDVQFVHPQPGFVLKTVVDGDKKAFVNICTNDKIDQPTSKKSTDSSGTRGLNWQIPHSFSPPREDFDKNKKTCMVYDVVFHPDTFRMTSNPRFKMMVEDTAMDGIERQFEVKLDRNNLKHPKLKYKGQPVATVIRKKKDGNDADKENKPQSTPDDPISGMPYPYSDKTSAELAEENLKNVEKREKDLKNKESKTKSNLAKKDENGYTTPNYSIIHRGYLELQEFTNARDSKPSTRPKEIVVSIELPLCKSAAGVELDIFEEKLVLKSEKPAYKLDLKLPYQVDDENGSARFDKSKKSLVVTLPVVAPEIPSISSEISTEVHNTSQPSLIEELPPLEPITKEDVPDDLPPLEEINDDHATSEKTGQETELLVTKNSQPKIAYNLPQYDYSQDKETVTFIFHVRNVTEESLSKSFPKQGSLLVRFISLGSGGFPMHYGFYSEFGDGVQLVSEHTMVDVSEKNMTLTLLKGKDCRFIWNSFSSGLDDSSLEEKFFLTTDNLNLDLDQLQLEGERMGQTEMGDLEGEQAPHVEVTEMHKKKLTIKISEPKGTFTEDDDLTEASSTPSSASIQIVHTKRPPEGLHGILKQRSMSESSEDHSSGSTGESPTSLSPREGDGPKHVTFSSHVDRTHYKINAATKTVTATLKNKRRHDRKREAKKEKTRRRRHNSNGSECSSCEDGDDIKHSSESHSDEDPEDLSELLLETSNKVESSGVIEEEDEKQSDDSQQEKGESKQVKRKRKKNKTKKLAEEVINKMAEVKIEDEKCDSDDDDSNERRSQADEVQNAQKDVSRTSNGEISENVSNDLNKSDVASKESVMAASENGGMDSGEPASSGSGTSGAIKGDNPNTCDQENINKVEGYHEKAGEMENKGIGDQLENLVETELSWKEVDREAIHNPHKTECAFQFSNAVMYDLDID